MNRLSEDNVETKLIKLWMPLPGGMLYLLHLHFELSLFGFFGLFDWAVSSVWLVQYLDTSMMYISRIHWDFEIVSDISGC